jgi:arginyl-tRNA synthetase
MAKDKDFEAVARQQFVRAIKKVFPTQTPLIGDKWFRFHAGGQRGDLEFTGVAKLAKATGSSAQRIASQIARHLSQKALGGRVETTTDHRILVHRGGGEDASG